MGKQLLASKVIFQDAEAGIPESIEIPTSVTAFVGVAEKGPIGSAERAVTWDEWNKKFGGFVSSLAEAAFTFFAMGGTELYTVRTCHYTDITIPSSYTATKAVGSILEEIVGSAPAEVDGTLSGPFSLVDGDTVILSVDGAPGVTATFNATPALVTSGAVEPFALVGGETLTVQINGGVIQTITIAAADITVGAATALEVANAINKELVDGTAYVVAGAVVIQSDQRGTGASVQVTGGTANAVLTFPVLLVNGGGNVADILGVTVAEVKTVVEAAVGGVVVNTLAGGEAQIATVLTGAGHSIQVDALSTADGKIGLDNLLHVGVDSGTQVIATVNALTEGSYGNKVQCIVSDASSGVTTEFNMEVVFNSLVVERYANLTMDTLADNYAITKVNNESDYIELVDAFVGNRPTNRTNDLLTGGDDGLVGLVDQDYIGNSAAQNGIYALDTVEHINIVGVPGVATPAVQTALVNYCSLTREELPYAITAPPQGSNYEAAVTYMETTSGLLGLSPCGGMFWPWPQITNPDTNVYGTDELITVPVDGVVAGRFALTDNSKPGGIYQAPAGLLYGTLDIVRGIDSEDAYEEPKRDVVYPKRINPIYKKKGTPFFIDGHRNLENHDKYHDIQQRRGASHIIAEMDGYLEYFKHLAPNKEVRAEVFRTLDRYLKEQTGLGAFESSDPKLAYSIDVGEGLNTPEQGRQGKLWVKIGFRMAGAIDWIIVLLSKNVVATS